MTLKKANSLILLFLLVSVNLYGCGNGNNDTLPDTERNPESFTSAKAAENGKNYGELSEKSYGFGYDKNFSKGEVPSIGFYAELLEGNHAYYTGDTKKKNIYLTFDAGYENRYTEKILDVLKAKKVPAAFFCTGDYLKCNKEIIDRMIKDGHIIGNHTWNHPKMPKVSDKETFEKELTLFDEYLFKNHKVRSSFFRYPEGEFSEKTLAMINDMGYTTVFWSLAYKDWERDVSRGVEYAVSQVTDQIHNGAIILLHAVSSDNAEALPYIIDKLRCEGYCFSSLEELPQT